MNTKTNKITEYHFRDDTQTGICEISFGGNNDYKCFIIPKDAIGDLDARQREILSTDCLYFLVNGVARPRPCVSMSVSFFNHRREVVWNTAIAFVSTNSAKPFSSYTKHLRYLVTKETKFLGVPGRQETTATNKPNIPEDARAEAEVIFGSIQALMLRLGYKFLAWNAAAAKARAKTEQTNPPEPATSDTPAESSDSDIRVYCSHKCDAQGIYNADKGTTVVKAGSRAAKETSDDYKKWHGSKREDLLEKHATYDGEYYVVSEDLEFGSPSAASDFCTGTRTNGNASWKDEHGNTLKEKFFKKKDIDGKSLGEYIKEAGSQVSPKGEKPTSAGAGSSTAEPLPLFTKHPPFIFYCNRWKAEARGRFDGKNLWVLKGSKIPLDNLPNLDSHRYSRKKEQREEFLTGSQVELSANKNYAVVKEDTPFPTPSDAGLICVGSTSSGWDDWKDKAGNRLGDCYVLCHSNAKHCDAKGIYQDGKVLVLAGSKVARTITGVYLNSLAEHDRLLKTRAKCQGDSCVLHSDIMFGSPSGAAAFCLGINTNGWTAWKNRKHKTLKELYPKAKELPSQKKK